MQSKALSKMCLSLLEQEKGWGQHMLHELFDNGLGINQLGTSTWHLARQRGPCLLISVPTLHLTWALLQRAPGFYFWVYGTKSNTRYHPCVFGWIKETRDGKHESHIQLSTSMNWNFYFSAPECPQRALCLKTPARGHLDAFSSLL